MAGDAGATRQAQDLAKFQSTPTNFMAGDTKYQCRCKAEYRFNPRPPISWRATNVTSAWKQAPVKFQSTPTNFMAGDPPPRLVLDVSIVSIHAHQFHGGRPDLQLLHWLLDLVSIHAHQFHGGRRRWPSWRWRPGRFNPRPPISWRATGPAGTARQAQASFNPRPPISWRATG